jgi:hypothetical protein
VPRHVVEDASPWGEEAAGVEAATLQRFAPLADHLIAVEPEASLIETWNGVDGAPLLEKLRSASPAG